jgi:hypothetical protein
MMAVSLLRFLFIWLYMNLLSWAIMGWVLAEQWSSVWVVILMVVTLLPAGIFYDRPQSSQPPAPPKRAFPSPL